MTEIKLNAQVEIEKRIIKSKKILKNLSKNFKKNFYNIKSYIEQEVVITNHEEC